MDLPTASIPRAYQLEILDSAIRGNTLAFLPTGSGKTLIAVLLIKHRLNEMRVRQNQTSEKRKQLIAFLAPTKILVTQQHRYIAGNCNAVVRAYTGDSLSKADCLVDSWSVDDWEKEFMNVDIMCMTPEILKNVLERKLLPLEVFDCVILDECHHACGKNPMATVCKFINNSTKYRPLVLGMTASPLSSKRGSVSQRIAKLESSTGCRLVAPTRSIAELNRHVPKPTVSFLLYSDTNSECGGLDVFSGMPNGLLVGIQRHANIKESTQSSVIGNSSSTIPQVSFSSTLPEQVPAYCRLNPSLCPAHVLYHAVTRAKLARYIDDICSLLNTLRLPDASAITELGGIADLVRTALGIRRHCGGAPTGAASLQVIQELLGQITRICEDCGTLAAMHALLTAFGGLQRTSRSSRAWLEDTLVWGMQRSSARRYTGGMADVKTSIDIGKYEHMVIELSSGPFVSGDGPTRGLCVMEQVRIACLLDTLVALLVTAGPRYCAAALEGVSDSTQCMGEGPREGSATWMDCVKHVMQAISCAQSEEQLSVLLSYDIGSCGVLSSRLISSFVGESLLGDNIYRPFELGGFNELVEAVCWACEAVLCSMDARDLTDLILSAEEDTAHGGGSLGAEIVKTDVSEVLRTHLSPTSERYGPCVHREPSPSPDSTAVGVHAAGVHALAALPSSFRMITAKTAVCFRDLFARTGGSWMNIISASSFGIDPSRESEFVGCDAGRSPVAETSYDSLESDRSDTASPPEDWACIVFCQMRLTVAAMSALLKQTISAAGKLIIDQHHCSVAKGIPFHSRLRPCHILGGFHAKVQDRTLLEFKCGEHNVLFATDVAEEGLDVRACQRIINFDAPPTVKSYVQRRGRARAEHSAMITLVSSGMAGRRLQQDIFLFMQQEEDMDRCGGPATAVVTPDASDPSTSSLSSHRDMASAELMEGIAETALDCGGLVEDESYVVPGSGVRVDMSNSVTVLNQYCAALPRDKFYTPAALYWTSVCTAYSFENCDFDCPMETQGYRCAVLLPSVVPPHIRCAVGPPASTKALAKCAVAMCCVRNLHIAGELDDRLRAIHSGSGKKKQLTSNPVNSKLYTQNSASNEGVIEWAADASETKDGKVVGGNSILCDCQINPEAIVSVDVKVSPEFTSPACAAPALTNINDRVMTRLYFYALDVHVPNTTHKHYAKKCPSCSRHIQAMSAFGIAFLQPLPTEVVDEQMDFSIRGVDLNTTIRCLGTREVLEDEMAVMQRFHRSLLCWETRVGSTLAEGCAVPFSEWARSGFGSWYLLFPVLPPLADPLGDCYPSDHWKSTSAALISSGGEWLQHLRICAEETEHLISKLWNISIGSEDVMDGCPSPQACGDLEQFVYTRKGDINFYVGGESRVCLTDVMDVHAATGECITFEDYYNSKNKLSACDMELLRADGGKLVNASSISGRLSLVQMTSDAANQLENLSLADHTHTKHVDLVPSHCIVIGKAKWFMTGLMAPSVIWRLHSLLLAMEARALVVQRLEPKISLHMLCSTASHGQTICQDVSEGECSNSPIGACGRYRLPSPALMLKALTPRQSLEAVDSERLEFLGDTVLKLVTSWAVYQLYPDRHEGYLTMCRTEVVSNAYQTAKARETDLAQYIRAVNISKGKQLLLFTPPGCYLSPDTLSDGFTGVPTHSLWNKDPRRGKTKTPPSQLMIASCRSPRHTYAEVKAKKLADMVEAVVGAFYEAGGIDAAVGIIRALGMLPQAPPAKTMVAEAKSLGACASEGVLSRTLIIPPGYPPLLERIACGGCQVGSSSADHKMDMSNGLSSCDINHARVQAHLASTLQSLCDHVGYSFTDWSLLDQALTHCSVPHKSSNQRLEFLGDAVLDLAVMSILYEASPTATQGALSDLKHRLLSNRHLTMVAISLELHKYMLTMSASLVSYFGDIATWIDRDVERYCEDVNRTVPVGLDGGKSLADCLEAVVGAVFIDSLCSMDKVREVVSRMKIIPDGIMNAAHNGYASKASC